MATDAQILANRQNAKHSTGPRTPAGKAKAALNALKHGFRSQIILESNDPLKGEPPAPYADLLYDLVQQHQPVGALESLALETMALALWRQRRVIAKELEIVAMVDPDEARFYEPLPDDPTLEDRPWYQERKRNEADPNWGPPTFAYPEKLLPLIRYEAHLVRQFQTAYRQLKELQSARLANEAASLAPSAPNTQPLTPTAPNEAVLPANPQPLAPGSQTVSDPQPPAPNTQPPNPPASAPLSTSKQADLPFSSLQTLPPLAHLFPIPLSPLPPLNLPNKANLIPETFWPSAAT